MAKRKKASRIGGRSITTCGLADWVTFLSIRQYSRVKFWTYTGNKAGTNIVVFSNYKLENSNLFYFVKRTGKKTYPYFFERKTAKVCNVGIFHGIKY